MPDDPPAAGPWTPPPPPIRVMVAETDAHLRSMLRHLLDGDNRFAVVAVAASGDEAVAAAPPYDIALVDLRISGLGGLGTIAELHRRSPAPLVVVLSETGAIYLRHAAEDEGAVGFLVRPADLVGLPDRLADIAGRARHAAVGS